MPTPIKQTIVNKTHSPSARQSEVSEHRVKRVKNITIDLVQAIQHLRLMDKNSSFGSFTITDGKHYKIQNGQVVYEDKKKSVMQTLLRALKMRHNTHVSADTKKLTSALQQSIAQDKSKENFTTSWDSHFFTHPDSVKEYMGMRGHQSKRDFQFIVHSAPIDHLIENKGIFSYNSEKNLEDWHVLSTSIINQGKIFTYGSVGVILKVPGQNVLVASPTDIMSETNIGLIERTQHLVNIPDKDKEKIRYEHMSDVERNGLLAREIGRYKRHTNTPDEVMKKTYDMRNEILICTTKGVNIHSGMKATDKVEIVGFFLNDCEPSASANHYASWSGSKVRSKDEKYDLFIQYAKPLAKELHLPLIYLNGTADTAI